MKKIVPLLSFSLSLAFYAQPALSATEAQINEAVQAGERLRSQERQSLERQLEAITPEKRPSGIDLRGKAAEPAAASSAQLPTNGRCIKLASIKVEGATLLDAWETEVFELPYLDKCITPELAQAVLVGATDYYLSRGFITTRAYLPNQDLKQGQLRIVVAEGAVDKIAVEGNDQSVPLHTTYPVDKDAPLNIRDLEQAVDQLNAVPGNNVTMAIKPGNSPQTSDVVFTNSGEAGVAGRVSLDNSGSESTGKDMLGLSLRAGDLLKLGETWSVSARQSVNGNDRATDSYDVSVRVPYGYNSYSAGASRSGYKTILTFPISGTQLTSEGTTDSFFAAMDRVIFRDQSAKHTIGARLKHDDTKSYIADTLIDVNSRQLNSIELFSESVMGFGKSVLVVQPEIAAGLSEVSNLPKGTNNPVENPQAEYLRYKLTLDLSHPFALGTLPLTWKSRLQSQYSSDRLYGSQQIGIGGQGSVRGFYDVSVLGDIGYYWQNSLLYKNPLLIGARPATLEFLIGYDTGHVRSNRPGAFAGGMQGMVVGATLNVAPFSFGLLWGMPMSIGGGADKGDSHLLTTVGVDF